MSSETTHTRFPSSRNTNPFTSFNRGAKYDKQDRRAPPINARASALLDKSPSQTERRNPFERRKNTRFANLCDDRERSPFSRDGESRERQGNRFRGNRGNYFSRRTPTIQKSPFILKQDEFPSLGGAAKKATVQQKPLAFGVAAERGKNCASPPPRPKLPPPARIPRNKKVESDNESDGWNTEDEDAARAADPSDDETDNADELFWGEGGFNDQ